MILANSDGWYWNGPIPIQRAAPFLVLWKCARLTATSAKQVQDIEVAREATVKVEVRPDRGDQAGRARGDPDDLLLMEGALLPVRGAENDEDAEGRNQVGEKDQWQV